MIRDNLKKIGAYAKKHGVKQLIKKSVSTIAEMPALTQRSLINVVDHYTLYTGHRHGALNGENLDLIEKGTIQWVIPDFGYGSGGHLNIFRFINLLHDLGFKQRIIIIPPYQWANAEEAKAKIESWYFPVQASVVLGIANFLPSEFTIATGWQTAYWVHHYTDTKLKLYFIQDFEPSFYPVSTEYYLAENTYRLNLIGITSGTWLKNKLTSEYGMKCQAISFACDKDFYSVGDGVKAERFTILFYSRHSTKRRLFELGLLALIKVCEKHPDVGVVFAGGDVSGYDIPFTHLNARELALSALPPLYRRCHLGLVLSGTNLSLLPLELAACKCPVVMNDNPCAKWLLDETAAFFAQPDPQALADQICFAIENEAERLKRAENAYNISQNGSWAAEAGTMAQFMRGL
jgi:O-antigen biosynthesis protein